MTRKPTKAPKIAKAQGRSVKEWVGKTPDAKPPLTVRVRVFDRHNGICHITGARIQPGDEWDCDHIKRLEDGGENRESNLAPALKEPHRKKTAEENKRGRKATRQRAAHIGAKPPSDNPIPQRAPPPKPEKHRKESPFAHLGLPAIARRFK